ncbi:MAG: hypothetical protein A2V70_06895 [Planctomycetes bacterium RBG_13_63_9]|nr:MAG: hypothetical protein A2V70_06895 [Planctomycetes bacterium RBG_13_63_9]
MRRAAVGLVLLVAVATSGDLRRARTADLESDRWEPAIRGFEAQVHRSLPGTRIVFVAIKPSISRWKLVDTMRRANELIRAVAEKHPRLDYVDVDAPMIGSDGKPRPELFRQDGLHLNAKGYQLWSKLVRPFLKLPSEAGSGPQQR